MSSKSLDELRDKLAEEYHGLERGNWGPDFAAGWDAAIKAVSDREKKLVEALEKINREELNSQRPGGGYSNSAKISYEALKEFRGGK